MISKAVIQTLSQFKKFINANNILEHIIVISFRPAQKDRNTECFDRRRKKIILRGFNPSRFQFKAIQPSRNFSFLLPSRFEVTRIKSKIFLSFFLDRLPFKGQTVAKNIGRIPASSSGLPIYSDVTQSSSFPSS